MANHLTPEELSKELGIDRETIIRLCVEEGVPIYQGKIDKHLFQAQLAGRRRCRVATRLAPRPKQVQLSLGRRRAARGGLAALRLTAWSRTGAVRGPCPCARLGRALPAVGFLGTGLARRRPSSWQPRRSP